MYYLAIIQNYGESNTLISFATLDEALCRYHSELAYRADTRLQTVCSILNAEGYVIRNETYTAEEQEPAETAPVEEPLEG